MVGAGFEGNVGGCAARESAGLTQGVHFGVRFARAEVETLADNLSATGDDAADAGVGRGGETAFAGEGEGDAHVVAVGVGEDGQGGGHFFRRPFGFCTAWAAEAV